MKDLKKAIQRCQDVLLIETWFRGFLRGKNLEYDYYRNEKDFKLIAAAKELISDGVCCRKSDSVDLKHIASIIKSRPETPPEPRPDISK